jgi:cytochrome c biogenesis protein CcdA
VLLIGALFSFAVFVTYLLVGLGFFAALRAAAVVPTVSAVLRWILVAALVVFAALSFYDYILVRRGRTADMLLQLPRFLKKRIHTSIRTRTRGDAADGPARPRVLRAAALAGSSLVLGFLVSLFEFACTGQVYLPTLAYLARMQGRADALGLLALYNVAFIVPLLVVFAASYAGTGQARIVALFQAHVGKVKIALGVVFAGLAVITLVA